MKGTNIYNKFSEKYDSLFLQNIEEFRKNYSQAYPSDDYFLSFYPMFGIKSDEKCDFLIYGQAVKGWRTGFSIIPAKTDSQIENYIRESNEYLDSAAHCPLDIVNVLWTKSTFNKNYLNTEIRNFYELKEEGPNYLFFRSFFWNVIYKTISDYYSLDRSGVDWSKKIVWSNLFKIAPEDENPTNEQRVFQLRTAIELVKREIEELKPKYCIVLTNYDWWEPFHKELNTNLSGRELFSDTIQSVETYLETQIIVTTRPFIGNSENHVKEILKIIGRADP